MVWLPSTFAMPLERELSLTAYRMGFKLRFESLWWAELHDRLALLLIEDAE